MENIYTACNFSHSAIHLPKLIKIRGNLTKLPYDRNKNAQFFLDTVYAVLVTVFGSIVQDLKEQQVMYICYDQHEQVSSNHKTETQDGS